MKTPAMVGTSSNRSWYDPGEEPCNSTVSQSMAMRNDTTSRPEMMPTKMDNSSSSRSSRMLAERASMESVELCSALPRALFMRQASLLRSCFEAKEQSVVTERGAAVLLHQVFGIKGKFQG